MEAYSPFPRAVEEMHYSDVEAYYSGKGYVSPYIERMCEQFFKQALNRGETTNPLTEAA